MGGSIQGRKELKAEGWERGAYLVGSQYYCGQVPEINGSIETETCWSYKKEWVIWEQ